MFYLLYIPSTWMDSVGKGNTEEAREGTGMKA